MSKVCLFVFAMTFFHFLFFKWVIVSAPLQLSPNQPLDQQQYWSYSVLLINSNSIYLPLNQTAECALGFEANFWSGQTAEIHQSRHVLPCDLKRFFPKTPKEHIFEHHNLHEMFLHHNFNPFGPLPFGKSRRTARLNILSLFKIAEC